MALKERPINADLPASQPGEAPVAAPKTPTPTKKPPAPKAPKRQRKPIPAALKAIAGLFVLAIVFIVAAIFGGRGGGSEGTETPAPASEAPGASAGAPAAQTPEKLGYPAFATANTTRVGGSDPASNAAGVALATYPSTEPSQQPDAVTLVDAGDWRSAIAASVLMAAPVGAPVLVSEADGVPEPTAQALAALDPPGGKATKGVQAFAIGAASVPSGLQTRRVGSGGGTAAAATIAALRDELLGGPPRHIVVAPAAQPAFAMPAAAWAARSGDPILFADEDKLPAPTAAALKRHPHTPVYVLGPSSAISSDVVRQIGKLSDRVRRVSGEDPASNAVALARYSDGGFGWNVNDPGHGFVVASSDEPLDAAAAAPLSASGAWGPLLLTESADTLPAALRGYLLDVKPGYTTDPTRAFYNHVWVIGDQEAIDVNEQAKIDELAELAKIGGEQ
ncbi:MAG TPA: cell wall-binding repeat-containing protein [Solirubrobacterales bacterium]|nr:cell wall-binding repeat-containing protein [Solirubrobacterales bacterium]